MIGLKHKKAQIIAFSILLFLAVAIAFVTLLPTGQLRSMHGNDKFFHFFAFALMAPPLLFITRTKVLKVAAVAILYGGAIELIQPILGRNAEVMDLVADIVGVIFAVIVALFWQRRVS